MGTAKYTHFIKLIFICHGAYNCRISRPEDQRAPPETREGIGQALLIVPALF